MMSWAMYPTPDKAHPHKVHESQAAKRNARMCSGTSSMINVFKIFIDNKIFLVDAYFKLLKRLVPQRINS